MNVLYPTDYCVYDTETTGLDPETCRVVEIAVKRRVGFDTISQSWLVKPDSPLTEEELRVCRDVNGIDPAELEAKGVPLEQALQEFVTCVKGLPLVGHNILRYDNRIMRRLILKRIQDIANSSTIVETERHEFVLPAEGVVKAMDDGRCVDTAGLFKADRLGAEQQWHESHKDFANRVLETRVAGLKFNLVHACATLSLKTEGLVAHRAGGDVEMADMLYRKLALGQ